MNEEASLPNRRTVETNLGDMIVSKPTLGTVATIAGRLRKAGLSIEDLGAGKSDREVGFALVLALAESLPAVLATVLSHTDSRGATREEVEKLDIEAGVNVVAAVVEMLDRKAIARLQESVRSAMS